MVGTARSWKPEQGKHVVMDIVALCLKMAEWQASDLFLSVGRVPSMRRAGEIAPTPGGTVLTDSDVEALLTGHLPPGTAERLALERDLDLGVALTKAAASALICLTSAGGGAWRFGGFRLARWITASC